MNSLLLAAADITGNGHTAGGAITIGAVVAIVVILYLIGKLFRLILRHPFISIILFLLFGFTIYKYAIGGILALGALAAVGVGTLWMKS